MTSKEIREARFESVKKGYDPHEVDTLLEKAADQIDVLTAERQQNEQKMELLAQKLEEYMAEEDKIRTTLLGAQKMSDTILREARQKADIISRDAAIKAERLVSAAHQKVEREEQSYVKIRGEVGKFKNDVLNIYRSHLEVLSMIPEPERPAEQEPESEPEIAEEPVLQDTEALPQAEPEAAADDTAVYEAESEAEAEAPEQPADIVEQLPAEKEPEPTVFSPFSLSGSPKPEAERRPNKFSNLDFGDDFSFDQK